MAIAGGCAPAGGTGLATVTERRAQVDDCVSMVMWDAANGDAAARAMWAQAGEDAGLLRLHCEELRRADPARLEEMSRRQAELDVFFAGAHP